jgi:ankyrin repeat protein
VIHSWNPPLPKFGMPLLAAMLLAGCDTSQHQALKELSEIGVEATGRSLVRAIADHDTARAALLLEAGVYTEQRDTHGRTPLGIAVENRDVAAAFLLLNARANVNAAVAHQACVLGIAVEQGDAMMVDTLLGAGARTDGLMPDGEKILPWAIRQGRLDLVETMMRSGADPHLKDRHGNPLLHVAMEAGRRDLMESLIKLGADPGTTNATGETTIQLALRQGWLDAIPKLAAAGADPNAPGPDGRTLLDNAVAANNPELVSLWLKIGADPNLRRLPEEPSTPLHQVFQLPDSVLFEIFLNHGAKPTRGNWDPWLWQAFRKRDLAKARLLLAHGARDSLVAPKNLRLVEVATLAGQHAFVKLLLDYGFNPASALYLASSRGDVDMVSLLLSSGVSPRFTRLPTKDTALSAAIRKRHDRVAELLAQYGADPSLSLPEGQTAFHLAIATGCHRTVKQLLAAGANPNSPFSSPASQAFLQHLKPGTMRWILKDDRNITPLMMAADSGSIQTARYLLDAGAKRNAWTRYSVLWPMHFATSRRDVRMMRLLLGRDPYREERVIEVRLAEQRAHMYDNQGNEIFATRISTGRQGFATPTGEFVITDKYRDWTSTLYHASMPYFQRLSCSDFGLHAGYVPGYPASHGCIRVPADNAAKLFSMTKTGDRVIILP